MTRGVIGFRHHGKVFTSIHDADSRPTVLGNFLISEIGAILEKGILLTWLKEFPKLRIVSNVFRPTPNDIKKHERFANKNTENIESWSDLLNNCQGSFNKTIESGCFLIHHDTEISYPEDFTSFGDYGYILDIENGTLDVFQEDSMLQMDFHALYDFDTDDIAEL